MWPWEHLAAGYLVYSLYSHLRGDGAPRGWPVVALAVGTQFPDLVDKPLSWTLGVLPSGNSLAHSVFVAVPVSALAVGAAAALGRERVGTAFAVGYLAHLPGDVFYPVVIGGRPDIDAVLWPLVSTPVSETNAGFVEMFRSLFDRYASEMLAGELSLYVGLELGMLVSVLAVWVYDGMPPLRGLLVRTPEESP